MTKEASKKRAQESAERYVYYALGESPSAEEAFTAKEDFMNGFLASEEMNDKVVKFLVKQLQAIMQCASDHQELCSLAVVRYTFEQLKKGV